MMFEATLSSELHKMKALQQFLELKPPNFDGSSDTPAAESWLGAIKAMLDAVAVSKEHRVALATYLFDGPAEDWWESIGNDFDQAHADWDKFEALFRNKFAASERQRRYATTRLGRLKQHYRVVAEYYALFVELCRGDPFVMADPALICDRFMRGLRPNVKFQLAPFAFTDFGVLVDVATRAEADYNARDKRFKRSRGRRESSGGGWSEPWLSCHFCGADGHRWCCCPYKQSLGMTVAEYHARFVQQFGRCDDDHVLRVIKFKEGLRPGISSVLQRLFYRDFDELVEAAKCAESLSHRKKQELLRPRGGVADVARPTSDQSRTSRLCKVCSERARALDGKLKQLSSESDFDPFEAQNNPNQLAGSVNIHTSLAT